MYNFTVSVSSDLREKAANILDEYKKTALTDCDCGEDCRKIVRAFNEVFDSYDCYKKNFIAELFAYDFIKTSSQDGFFDKYALADRLPKEYKLKPLYGGCEMSTEYIYGGLPSVFPYEYIAKKNGLDEKDSRRLYEEFWQKIINALIKEQKL